MTSPKISADKGASNATASKQNTVEPSNGSAAGTSTADTGVVPVLDEIREAGPYGVFSWMKVFRFANLMIKQGC